MSYDTNRLCMRKKIILSPLQYEWYLNRSAVRWCRFLTHSITNDYHYAHHIEYIITTYLLIYNFLTWHYMMPLYKMYWDNWKSQFESLTGSVLILYLSTRIGFALYTFSFMPFWYSILLQSQKHMWCVRFRETCIERSLRSIVGL